VESNVAAGLWEPSAQDLAALREVNERRGAGMRHASYSLR
jgi:hypothetical protein